MQKLSFFFFVFCFVFFVCVACATPSLFFYGVLGLCRSKAEYARFRRFVSNLAQFSAPEVFNGVYTKAGDIWSIGIILFLTTFGFLPFSNNDASSKNYQNNNNNNNNSNMDHHNNNKHNNHNKKTVSIANKNLTHNSANAEIRKLITQTGFRNELNDGAGPWFPRDMPVSLELRELMANMLNNNSHDRWTISQCLESEWVKNHLSDSSNNNGGGIFDNDDFYGNNNKNDNNIVDDEFENTVESKDDVNYNDAMRFLHPVCS